RRAQLRRAPARQVRGRRKPSLHAIREPGVRGWNLPHARLVGIDADVTDLYRVGWAPKRGGPGRRYPSETTGRDTDDVTRPTPIHASLLLHFPVRPEDVEPLSGRRVHRWIPRALDPTWLRLRCDFDPTLSRRCSVPTGSRCARRWRDGDQY